MTRYIQLIKKFIKCKMYSVINILLKILKRISKLTLYEVLCIGATILIILTWTWWKKEIEIQKNSDNPIIIWWTSGFPGTSKTIHCKNLKCDTFSNIKSDMNMYNVDAYLFYASNIHFDNLPLPRRAKDVIWGLYHEESPRNVEELMHEVTLSLFNYSATFSRHSDVPFPLQYLESLDDITSLKYFVPTKVKNDILKEISPVLYLQSDCETSTERDTYVKEVMKLIKVDSYGTCLNNKEMPTRFAEDYLNNLNDDDFLRFIARYKFVLALENGICDDYVTEKFWRAIKVGVVPIYFGSPSIQDWFPNNKSAILLKDYPTPKILSDYITELLKNDSLYEEHLRHKTKVEIANERLINEFKMRGYQTDSLETAHSFECLICEKIHDKRMGKQENRVVDKSHYNCPKPISALTLEVNPFNDWVFSWKAAKVRAQEIYEKVVNY